MKAISLLLFAVLAYHGVSFESKGFRRLQKTSILFQSSALNQAQVLHLQELNTSFDLVHKNFDFRINNAFVNMTSEMKILQAQLISRLGFVTDEIRMKEMETRFEINVAANMTSAESECIVELQESLENAVQYVGYSINGVVGEVKFYVDQIEHDYFYPYIGILQRESNIIQWMVLSEIRRGNPVDNMERVIERLEDDYFVVHAMYQSAVSQIPAEMVRLHDHMDEVKEFYFPQLNSIRDYFRFSADMIKDSLPACMPSM